MQHPDDAPDKGANRDVVSWCRDTVWLGGPHNGYRLCLSLAEYDACRRYRRRPYSPTSDHDIGFEEAALFQSLLTFGLVEAVTGQKLREEQLIRTSPTGERVISCENLSPVLADFRRRLNDLKEDRSALQVWHDQIEDTLMQAQELLLTGFMDAEQNLLHGVGLEEGTIGKIQYMIAAIGEALTLSRLFKHYTSLEGTRAPHWGWARKYRSKDVYGEEMRARGWCPFTIETFTDRLCVLGYAHSQPPPFRPTTYRSHETCTMLLCKANDVVPGTYRTRHVSEDCGCLFHKPPLSQVTAAILAEQIPVIKVIGSDDQPLQVICMSSDNTPYVAISHVWADGLGSTTESGLPTCQLQRLAALTESLMPGAPFWIDSLCIPEDRTSRKQAIRMMARTYSEAQVVLVIDAGIYSCPVDAPIERRLLAIRASAWVQRLWTLQEALLARELKFLFGGCVVDFKDFLKAGNDDDTNLDPVQTPLLLEVARLWSQRKRIQKDFKLSLSEVVQSLQRRTSSKIEDEPLAIASLLGVNVKKIVDTPRSERMKALLLDLQTIPSSIIFIHDGEKLKNPGFGWAPASFMIDAVASATEETAYCTSDGLIANYYCLHIDSMTFGAKGPYCLLDKVNRCGFWLVGVKTFSDTVGAACNALLLERSPRLDAIVIAGALVSLQQIDTTVRSEEPERIQVQGICTYLGTAGVRFCTFDDLRKLILSGPGYVDEGNVKDSERLTLCIK
ncbi:uncharacterized protein LAESUDRAFT_360461 [Laetiporus sulphureus 93-53]|uniref:Heterokaryon incompatibility domain-containing protein n=1 Tax=Laetiporus sulphureus 93-53 TaxID=1314785 RepID=A0A165GYK4_9APHY|nr:uncharacterized protein LAESUDRAFT_360461 [Laetiporus sulphureus 93-53]KZT11002.1 hypothetical protein LAESUDRAFT_360461 [Laetiporus sulphureus 93-53]